MEKEELQVLKRAVKAIQKLLYEVKPNLWSEFRHDLDVAYSEGRKILIKYGVWDG